MRACRAARPFRDREASDKKEDQGEGISAIQGTDHLTEARAALPAEEVNHATVGILYIRNHAGLD